MNRSTAKVSRVRFALLSVAGVVAACAPPAAVPADGVEDDRSDLTTGTVAPPDSIAHPADLALRLANHYDVDELEAHAEAIVAHQRPSGSEGENAAIDYIVATLSAAGVPVEVHELRAYVSTPVSASIRVIGTDLEPPAITMAYSAPAEAMIAELVDVGELEDLPRLEVGTGERVDVIGASLDSRTSVLSDFPDVRGKIALVTGQPRGGPTDVLEALGAVGVVFANPEERLNELIVTSTWGSPSLRNFHRLPNVPVAQVTRSGGDALRRVLDDGRARIQLDVDVDEGWRTLRLAVATIEPAGRRNGPFVLFGGHIDSWYYGATDEGASNAAMIALAEAFYAERATLRRGVVVAWWPGHSNGRYAGSTWYADTYASSLRERALAYVNVDGIGQRGASRFAATATASLSGLARAVVLDAAGVQVDASPPATNSDQSFNGVGLPLLQLYHNRSEDDRGTWWWHTPDDTFDKIDFEVLKQDTDLYATALASLTAAPLFPVDLVAQAQAAGDALATRASEANGRFDPANARAGHFQMARAFAELQVDARGVADEFPDLDVALVDVLRPLHRALYVAGSTYHPDAGRNPGLLPGLSPAGVLAEEDADSDRFGFALTTLIREENRIAEAFVESADRARALSDRIKRRGESDD